jgi:hypothetical protein
LALLFEQRAAQHRLRRQPPPPGLVQSLASQVTRHQGHQSTLAIQPARNCFQFAADLVLRKDLKYRGLEGAFLTHFRLRR